MLLIFKRLWQVNWAEQWQYRANLIMYLLYWLVSPSSTSPCGPASPTAKGRRERLTANDFITYYMILLIATRSPATSSTPSRTRSRTARFPAN
jgi:ABC-type uncharacterized transport system permease subunit